METLFIGCWASKATVNHSNITDSLPPSFSSFLQPLCVMSLLQNENNHISGIVAHLGGGSGCFRLLPPSRPDGRIVSWPPPARCLAASPPLAWIAAAAHHDKSYALHEVTLHGDCILLQIRAANCEERHGPGLPSLKLFRRAVSVTLPVIALCGVLLVSSVCYRELRTTQCHCQCRDSGVYYRIREIKPRDSHSNIVHLPPTHFITSFANKIEFG
ncbi:hypothetical protein E2C01_018895 [Portunus trituberculatus]|uniref:Uncharacterized protein n=1 Tax=Portunus trituberculatus TaxID=210409 RepID=A0A5B7DXU0_PORTR|nr:hypothetical protein [Portunus trituberculatus]